MNADQNWIILLNGSKSMDNKIFQSNKFKLAIMGIKTFIEEKYRILPGVKISFIIFNEKISVISELTDDIPSILKYISSRKFKTKYYPDGTSEKLDKALITAINLMAQQIQNISGFKNNIMLISDKQIDEISKISQKTREIINGLKISLRQIILKSQINVFDNLSQKSVVVFSNRQDFLEGMKRLATPAIIRKDHTQKFSELIEEKKKNRDIMEEIAKDLRYPTLKELSRFKDKFDKIHCQICFSKKSPVNNYSLYKTGRFCPHCGTPMHLHCAALWALKSSEHKNLFRCPYCYTLLKISPIIIKGLKIKKNNNKKTKKGKQLYVKMILTKSEKDFEINRECFYCFKPMHNLEEQQIFQCSNCKAYYHQKCLEKMYKEDKKCLNCGGLIV